MPVICAVNAQLGDWQVLVWHAFFPQPAIRHFPIRTATAKIKLDLFRSFEISYEKGMRSIQVSTDVFSAIWKNRLPGEETEDSILRRLLAVQSAHSNPQTEVRKMLWRDDVRNALIQLGGEAYLTEIYGKVRQIRLAAGRRLPRSTDAIVRRELEYNSSDSESYTGNYDWFRSVNGIGGGRWGIRPQASRA
jgi:hypothetical protein